MSRSRSSGPARGLALALLGFLLGGCGQDVPGSRGGETIDTEIFMQAIVDLRVEAISRSGTALPPEEAERILESHGIEAEALRRFVEVHGRNVPFMNSVWAEVDRRLQEASEARRESEG